MIYGNIVFIVMITPLTLTPTKLNFKKKGKKEEEKKTLVINYIVFEGCHHAANSRHVNFYLRVKKLSLF